MKQNATELEKIQSAANSIKNDSDVLLVIGIGGSYLGAKAALNLLQHTFTNMFSDKEKDTPHIIFAGQHMSSTYIQELLSIIKDKDVSINVISKSGTTTEPAIAFSIFRTFMEEKYGIEESGKRIYVTTDKEKDDIQELNEPDLFKNPAYQYAAARHRLYERGYTTEILANYEPKLSYFASWWVQLFGESEGKENKGIFPTTADFTTDLHSLGQ